MTARESRRNLYHSKREEQQSEQQDRLPDRDGHDVIGNRRNPRVVDEVVDERDKACRCGERQDHANEVWNLAGNQGDDRQHCGRGEK